MAILEEVPEEIIPATSKKYKVYILHVDRSLNVIDIAFQNADDEGDVIHFAAPEDEFVETAVALGLVEIRDKIENHALAKGLLTGTKVPD